MQTYTALTTLTGDAAAEALGAAMERLDPAPTGVGVFEIEEKSALWEVGGYFIAPPDETALALLAAAHGARPFAVSKLEDRDWVAQVRRELTPVPAGRFFVYGAHDADRLPLGAIGLRIEAAVAFGTGHHETTRGCLLAIDRLARLGAAPRRVADIGCGTGILAMAAAREWRVPVLATDIDAVAAETARENARANGVGPLIDTGAAVGFAHPLARARAPFDLILANILARPLMKLAPEIAAHATPGGHVVLSGILTRQAAMVEGVYRSWGMHRVERIVLGDWTTFILQRGRFA